MIATLWLCGFHAPLASSVLKNFGRLREYHASDGSCWKIIQYFPGLFRTVAAFCSMVLLWM